MSGAPNNSSRRKFLTAATAVVGGAGCACALVPFVASWKPSKKAENAAAPVVVDLTQILPDQLFRVEWQGKPVWIIKRSPAVLAALPLHENKLRDPASNEPQQPNFAKNPFRSIRPDIFVAVGICTHLGCSPMHLPNQFEQRVEGVADGFFCPCHGSKFDMAGRVFKNVPAPLNLMIPPYYFIDNNTLLIGELAPNEAV